MARPSPILTTLCAKKLLYRLFITTILPVLISKLLHCAIKISPYLYVGNIDTPSATNLIASSPPHHISIALL